MLSGELRLKAISCYCREDSHTRSKPSRQRGKVIIERKHTPGLLCAPTSARRDPNHGYPRCRIQRPREPTFGDQVYLEILKNGHYIDCQELNGGDYFLRRDNAPADTKQKKAKDWSGRHMPKTLESRPARSNDLNVLDYAIWAIVAR